MFLVNTWSDGDLVSADTFDTLPEAEAEAKEQSHIYEYAEVYDGADNLVCAYEMGIRLVYDDDDGCLVADDEDDKECEFEDIDPDDFADDEFVEVGYDPYTGGYDMDL